MGMRRDCSGEFLVAIVGHALMPVVGYLVGLRMSRGCAQSLTLVRITS